jgi:aldehyde dehydrogenase (NAD+)
MTRVDSSVAGSPLVGAAGTVTSTNPARLSDVVAEVSLATPEQLVEAFRAAKAAQPAWGATPAPVRGQVIAKIGRLVEANFEALAQLVTREVGKPIAEARGEVQEIVDTCDFFLGEGRRLYGQTVPSEMRDKQLFTFRVPVGVAGIITAGNFPVAGAVLVPRAGAAVRQRRRVEAADYAAALATRSPASSWPAAAAGRAQHRPRDGPSTFDGLQLALEQGLVHKIGFTGSSRSAPASASWPAATCRAPASSSAARTRSS